MQELSGKSYYQLQTPLERIEPFISGVNLCICQMSSCHRLKPVALANKTSCSPALKHFFFEDVFGFAGIAEYEQVATIGLWAFASNADSIEPDLKTAFIRKSYPCHCSTVQSL